MSCVYLGEPVGENKLEQPAFHCNYWQCHVVEGMGSKKIPGCPTCKKSLLFSDGDFSEKWEDPLEVLDRTRKKTKSIRNLLAGSSVFLACSGPSANELPLEKLQKRGIWTLSVNNMAGHPRLRPQAFVCSDPPSKFSHSIWLDPAIMKWIPTPKMNGGRANLKEKIGEGKFILSDKQVGDCPNVWGFRRNPWLTPDDDFFLSNGASWGNQDAGVKRTGEKKTVNTMLLAMRILRYLGVRRVFMIGVDFRMASDYGYSFTQGIQHKRPKDKDGNIKFDEKPKWDNNQYSVVNEWLYKMQQNGVFKRFGIEFYNCFEHSSLRAFPCVPFEQALRVCQGKVEEVPDLSQWYEKLPMVKKQS